MSATWALLISLVLLALNGFFVAAEFALVASKQHRLEQAAADGSRAARVALSGVRDLSLMLAGAQLGITLCTLGLGALAEPAIEHLLDPVFHAVGVPDEASHVIALVIAIGVVGLLHVLLGEMAPKSWAISNPETSALRLAMPFVLFTRLFRPALLALNAIANACLRLAKVTPQDELAQAHGPEELRILIESSGEHGTIDAAEHELLSAMLKVQETTVSEVMTPATDIAGVPPTATAREIELASRAAGRSRLAVVADGGVAGIVHVRDAVRASSFEQDVTAADLMNDAVRLPADKPVATAIRLLRDERSQLAIVHDAEGHIVGLVALEDMLEQVIGDFDDETDPVLVAARNLGDRRRAESTPQ
ncbi:CBS domain containing-hemolysin-like protein [Kribbella amoyensis]|uniref:CBS domain containing-hemolysin-like protein n=1 Tax=Kribbella amoyensis TaxID=996641 RepID=A0A561BS17_9ACTN|nr:hemolysin family protein [Kribbella amoyensis]TWD81687.1 CBS domain containing-hemolysin-like protein [Kribbella amoyensis]